MIIIYYFIFVMSAHWRHGDDYKQAVGSLTTLHLSKGLKSVQSENPSYWLTVHQLTHLSLRDQSQPERALKAREESQAPFY